ncbi:hypothetical protein B566_EDAN002345 [Ephemera danica]|nr:hypothetical protein B566_EDAN002345 [Ephemera danica]
MTRLLLWRHEVGKWWMHIGYKAAADNTVAVKGDEGSDEEYLGVVLGVTSHTRSTMAKLNVVLLSVFVLVTPTLQQACQPSVTRFTLDNKAEIPCSRALIFEDNFDTLNLDVWNHEITMAGGLTEDQYGLPYLSSGTISLWGGAPADQCTNPSFWGCERTGNPVNILNPTKSARIRTVNSFSFMYGTVEVRAKMPAGDWLWPAIWMMPKQNAYGTWPLSGEIDLVESRGNLNLVKDGQNIGSEMAGNTLHFGPFWPLNGYESAHFETNTAAGQGFDTDFHLYQLEWTPDYLLFKIDNVETGRITPPAGGFYEFGNFAQQAPGSENPWRYGTKMAPFDQEFYMIINLAVGGVAYFPDDAQNPGGKPWTNDSPQAMLDFLNGRGQWEPTWDMSEGGASSLVVDYVRVWSL